MSNPNSGCFFPVPGHCNDAWSISDKLQKEGKWDGWKDYEECAQDVCRGPPQILLCKAHSGCLKLSLKRSLMWHLRGSFYPCWISAVLSHDRTQPSPSSQHTRLPLLPATCELHGNQAAAVVTSIWSVGRQMLELSLDKFWYEASPGMCWTITHQLFSFAKDTPGSGGSVLRMPVNKRLLVISLRWLKADFCVSGTSKERNFRQHGVFLAHMWNPLTLNI